MLAVRILWRRVAEIPYLEHRLTQEEVDTTTRLRTRATPIKPQPILRRLRKRTLDPKRPVPVPIIINEVDKSARLLIHMFLNQLSHRTPRPLQQDVRGSRIDLRTKARTELANASSGCAARGDESEEVGSQPVGLPGVAAHEFDDGLVHAAALEEFHGGDLEAIVEDRLGVDGHGARDLALNIGHCRVVLVVSFDVGGLYLLCPKFAAHPTRLCSK